MNDALRVPGRDADRELPRPPAPRWLWWSIVAAALATLLCLAALAWAPLDERVPLHGVVEPEATAVVHAPLDAAVAALLARPGMTVAAGEPLLRLDPAPWLAERALLTAELARAEAWLAEARAAAGQALPHDLLQAASEAAAAAGLLAEQRALVERLAAGGEGAVPATELARARAALREAERAAARAEAARQLADGAWGEAARAAAAARRDAAAAAVAALRARLARLEAELAACAVVAPAAGRVLALRELQPGARVVRGEPLARLALSERRRLRLWAGDADIGRLRPGLAVRFRARSDHDRLRPPRRAVVTEVLPDRPWPQDAPPGAGPPPYLLFAAPLDELALPLGVAVDGEAIVARRRLLALILGGGR